MSESLSKEYNLFINNLVKIALYRYFEFSKYTVYRNFHNSHHSMIINGNFKGFDPIYIFLKGEFIDDYNLSEHELLGYIVDEFSEKF